MNEVECQEAYDTLAGILKSKGLEWITIQVAEQIRIGKTIQREMATLKEELPAHIWPPVEEESERQLRKGPKATFLVPVKYSAPEKLALLLDATKRAIIDTADMANEVIGYFGRQYHNGQGIQFIQDELGTEPKTLTASNAAVWSEYSNTLRELINALRKEI